MAKRERVRELKSGKQSAKPPEVSAGECEAAGGKPEASGRGPGRPAGSKTSSPDLAQGVLTRCKKCGSTNRTAYFGTPYEFAIAGLDADGRPFTHIVRRRCKCADCGQLRLDQYHENRGRPRAA